MTTEHVNWFKEGTSREVKELAPIFDKSAFCIEEYGEQMKDSDGWDDVPYWWGEMQNINILSAAVWLLGGVTRVEFSIVKGQRADLFFMINGEKYLIEAKHLELNLENPDLYMVTRKIDEAANQCLRYSDDIDGACSLAAVFLDIYVNNSKRSEFDALLKKLLIELKTADDKNRSDLFFSTCFPKQARNLKEKSKDEDIVWPGVILLGSRVRWSPSVGPLEVKVKV